MGLLGQVDKIAHGDTSALKKMAQKGKVAAKKAPGVVKARALSARKKSI